MLPLRSAPHFHLALILVGLSRLREGGTPTGVRQTSCSHITTVILLERTETSCSRGNPGQTGNLRIVLGREVQMRQMCGQGRDRMAWRGTSQWRRAQHSTAQLLLFATLFFPKYPLALFLVLCLPLCTLAFVISLGCCGPLHISIQFWACTRHSGYSPKHPW